MTRRFGLCLLVLSIGFMPVDAQTDMTSSIDNPSFENGFTGWEHKSMGTQTNSVFSIKHGNTYVEKWTGRGGAVGSGQVSQQLTQLPPGNYELTAAAQNIQEDTPNTAQRGAWIFAGDAETTVTTRSTYAVQFAVVNGTVQIGFKAIDASGNWIAVDNFRLTLLNEDLSQQLAEAIAAAETTLGDGSGRESEQLRDAITAAKAVAESQEATGRQQADAIMSLQDAVDLFLRANASEENPLDMKHLIENPSFETGDFTGWTQEHMATQSNTAFPFKHGNIYVEKWTGRGGAVGDALVSQTITNVPCGRYRLTVAAQNIQEDTPNQMQQGTWIFANTFDQPVSTRQHYTLDFVLVSDEMTIGFRAKNATGNYLAVDNFRLEYTHYDIDEIREAFRELTAQAEQLASCKMNAAALQSLTQAIENAQALIPQNTTEGWGYAARVLEAACKTAQTSIEIFAQLKTTIEEAQRLLEETEVEDKSALEEAVQKGIDTYDSDISTDADAQAAIQFIEQAAFALRVANGTGEVPTVVTDTRFIRGATWAFGRSKVTGSNIMEQGFCWSTNPDPKVTDNRTTEYLNQQGRIYWLRDLKPATVYYMRAYAMTKDYAVGYGDVIKFVTVPKGTITHWYNNGGDEATNDRLNSAINSAIDYYWNNLSSIRGFGISVNYSPGTPTADCSYGGWMRVGENASYQQVGTIMHEAFHGIGVGTHDMWWNGEMRSAGNRGDWLGDRVTEAVRFWDNSTTAVITGDDMHLWPYGCNGAQEDTHNDNLYCMMGILAQALNEDGLPGSAEIGYALPYYSFNHEDDVKYYIKNENENRGLHTSYLVETENHQLRWVQMSADEARNDDAAAWYLTFTPGNQYYQLRNAASGYYITYSGGFKTANHNTPTAADNLHLMRGRVDIKVGTGGDQLTTRGYYIIHPESKSNPSVLTANANGQTGSTAFNIAKSATSQRWIILTDDDMQAFESGAVNAMRGELAEVIARIRELAKTPHTECVEGVDETLTNELATIENEANSTSVIAELSELVARARQAGMSFLENVSADHVEQPFDLTFMIQNPDFNTDATTGWNTASAPGYGGGGAEFYEKTFNFNQTLSNMPSGVYDLHALAFQRPGETDAVYTQYAAGTSVVTSYLYIDNTSVTIKNICEDSQPSALFNDGGWGSDKRLGNGRYVPNCMDGAARYFNKGLYDNSVAMKLETSGSNMKIGIRCTQAGSYYWTMFDHFRLFFYGQNATILGVKNINMSSRPDDNAIYDLTGRRIHDNTQLPKGIYIVGKKKVVYK